jgi:hypothetical protein
MTLEEAVTAYSLAYGSYMWIDQYVEGEKEFISGLLEQLRGQYYSITPGDILSCARDPSLLQRYERLNVEGPQPHTNIYDMGPKNYVVVRSGVTLGRRIDYANRSIRNKIR